MVGGAPREILVGRHKPIKPFSVTYTNLSNRPYFFPLFYLYDRTKPRIFGEKLLYTQKRPNNTAYEEHLRQRPGFGPRGSQGCVRKGK
jgi:hypothetical protein